MKPNGTLLRRKRIEGGYSINALSRELGIDKGQISRVERGIEGMSPRNLKKLSVKLGVPMRELIPELGEMDGAA